MPKYPDGTGDFVPERPPDSGRSWRSAVPPGSGDSRHTRSDAGKSGRLLQQTAPGTPARPQMTQYPPNPPFDDHYKHRAADMPMAIYDKSGRTCPTPITTPAPTIRTKPSPPAAFGHQTRRPGRDRTGWPPNGTRSTNSLPAMRARIRDALLERSQNDRAETPVTPAPLVLEVPKMVPGLDLSRSWI